MSRDEPRIKELEQQNQKAIECLKDMKEKLKIHCEYSGNNGSYIGWYLPESKIDIIIDNKIKELEGK